MSPYKSGMLFRLCGFASLAIAPDRLLERLGSRRMLLAWQNCLGLLAMVSFVAAQVDLGSKGSTTLRQIATMSMAQVV